ncbi:TatA/E family twin arginine-targeting protein translocase [Synechococcales cyanobacterium C]|uniref:Sec-independent protein translocase protein TatA n=1 Tax=Petrachloros mirabilis ULC683 TaxID=2781853 RepID=A0A8K1ZXT5_9CYAN|nr:TatA/E family twin arginine-targeting protein translocase [Petrachloros mirabilis]NCJ06061.1 TatA/E family twin arginine-targeting protein translocase [Petrachloros mirabilis ULC683]
MNVFGIGLPEMILILVVALLVFGPKKLPEIGRSLGKGLRSFQDATKEFESEFKREAEKASRTLEDAMEAELETPSPSERPQLSQAADEPQSEPAEVAQSSEASPTSNV